MSYEDTDNIKPRKYYHITDKGRKYLKKLSTEWNEYASVVSGFIGGVTFGTV